MKRKVQRKPVRGGIESFPPPGAALCSKSVLEMLRYKTKESVDLGVETEKSAGGGAESTKVHSPAARGAESIENDARVEARVKPGSLGGLGRSVRAGRCNGRWCELAAGSSRAGQYRLYTAYCRTWSKRGNGGVCKHNNKFIARSALKTLDYKQNPRVLSGLLEITICSSF